MFHYLTHLSCERIRGTAWVIFSDLFSCIISLWNQLISFSSWNFKNLRKASTHTYMYDIVYLHTNLKVRKRINKTSGTVIIHRR